MTNPSLNLANFLLLANSYRCCHDKCAMMSDPCRSTNNVRHTIRWIFVRLDLWYSRMMDTKRRFWFCHVCVLRILNAVRVMNCQCSSMYCVCCHCWAMIHDSLNRDRDVYATLSVAHQIDSQCPSYLLLWNWNLIILFRCYFLANACNDLGN